MQPPIDDDAVNAAEPANGVRVHVRVDVDLVRSELAEERIDVGHDAPDHLLELRRPAKVARIRHEDQRRSVIPLAQHVGPAGERARVEGGGVEVRQLRQQMRRHRRIGGAAQAENAEHGDAGPLEPNDDRVRIGRRRRGDVVPAVARLDVVRRIDHGAVGEEPIRRRQRRAVGPDDAVAQVHGDPPAVAADAAVAQRRHLGREIGNVVAARVVAQHEREEHAGDRVGGRGVREHQVEAVGFFVFAQAQDAGDRPCVVPAVARRALRARAAGECDGQRQPRGRDAREAHRGASSVRGPRLTMRGAIAR